MIFFLKQARNNVHKCIGNLKCDIINNRLYNKNPDIFSIV